MSWRTLVISSKCKLSYKNNYLIVRNDDVKMIHLSEVNTLVIDTTNVSITTILMCELLNRRVKIIFCDEKHNPKGEVVPYYGCHNTSKKVMIQSKWSEDMKGLVWQRVISNKIENQGRILEFFDKTNSDVLINHSNQVEVNDETNREGHAAKIYFNSLFGSSFVRDEDDNINSALNYGYAILLSTFNKEITSNGYITQLGINHRNEFNQFNLGSDLMEPFRPLVDKLVYLNKEFPFDKDYKYKLINILNEKVVIEDSKYYASNAISLYVGSIFKALETGKLSEIIKVSIV
ncbi:type II CRISPR-associated endonuclease Cas1 [Clostridium sp.]|uniref:type II CRISPR-associated endonuclease Cas1 n=1 Tax=Clostridium sp. TaxID=1506 RepID=UPI002FCC8656